MRGFLVALVIVVLAGGVSNAAGQAPDTAEPKAVKLVRPELHPARADHAPAIDGLLDDDVWQSSAIETGTWLSYNPLHGDTIPQTTRVWMAYDADYIYFAFQCDDPDPSGIKTSMLQPG